MNERLAEIIKKISETGDLDDAMMKAAFDRQEELAKPMGSLGELEAISIRLAGINGEIKNSAKKQAILIFSADNGVVEEGVASAPQSVTFAQTINFTRGLTGVSSIAEYWGIDLLVTDMGVKMDIPAELLTDDNIETVDGRKQLTKKIVNRRLAAGTKNLAKEPAMSREDALKALLTGVEAVKSIKELGYDIFGIGEMGIGNTTTSACVLAALTGEQGKKLVGRGGGLMDEGLARKIEIVTDASKRENREDVIGILAEVGGFDIAAMVGAYLGAAYYRLPVVIDGYISATAAYAASRICPKAKNFMFASHKSTERGYLIALEGLELKPLFDLGMRLGEGSGCPISFKIIETATAAMNNMATFSEGSIDAEYLAEIRAGNFF